MKLKYGIVFIAVLILFLFISPVFAANLTVTGSSLAPVYANTNTSVDILNLTITVASNIGDTSTNITYINFTLVSGTSGNISAITVKNSTGTILGVNTSINPSTNTSYTIYLTNGFFINGTVRNASLVVSINVSRSASKNTNLSVNISSPAEIRTVALDNITVVTTQSNEVLVQNLHANVTISPRFVDT